MAIQSVNSVATSEPEEDLSDLQIAYNEAKAKTGGMTDDERFYFAFNGLTE